MAIWSMSNLHLRRKFTPIQCKPLDIHPPPLPRLYLLSKTSCEFQFYYIDIKLSIFSLWNL